MARKLFMLYLAIMLGPLALAIAAWTIRDALKAAVGSKPGAGVRGDGSEEGLAHTVEEVRAAGD